MSISGIDGSTMASVYFEAMKQSRSTEQEKPDEHEMAASFIEDKDQDGDGVLTLEEAGIPEEMFAEADEDGDGMLTEDEIASDMESRHQQMDMMNALGQLLQNSDSESLADLLVEQSDTDADDALSLEESGLEEELFNALDTDGDGVISKSEIAAALSDTDLLSTLTAASEESSGSGGASGGGGGGGGSSSEDEEEYDEYDFNEDGTVTMDELRQAYENGDLSLAHLFQGEEGEAGMRPEPPSGPMQAYRNQDGDMPPGPFRGIA